MRGAIVLGKTLWISLSILLAPALAPALEATTGYEAMPVTLESFHWTSADVLKAEVVQGDVRESLEASFKFLYRDQSIKAYAVDAESQNFTVKFRVYPWTGVAWVVVISDITETASVYMFERQDNRFISLYPPGIRARAGDALSNIRVIQAGLALQHNSDEALTMRLMVQYFTENPQNSLYDFLLAVENKKIDGVIRPIAAVPEQVQGAEVEVFQGRRGGNQAQSSGSGNSEDQPSVSRSERNGSGNDEPPRRRKKQRRAANPGQFSPDF